MAKKNITIETLAEMINNGFQSAKEHTDKRFDGLEKDMAIVKAQLADAVLKSEFQQLEHRVDYLENILNVKK